VPGICPTLPYSIYWSIYINILKKHVFILVDEYDTPVKNIIFEKDVGTEQV
jgi:hypothetical protein